MFGQFLRITGFICLALGIAVLGYVGSSLVRSSDEYHQGIATFHAAKEAQQRASIESLTPHLEPVRNVDLDADKSEMPDNAGSLAAAPIKGSSLLTAPPDQSDWSEKRINAFKVLTQPPAEDFPEGIVRIPAIGLEIPVFSGTQEVNLTRGAGRIEGTPPLGDAGNTGIASHRDGYFRALKDVEIGHEIEVETFGGVEQYSIVDLLIVDPEDIHVLDESEHKTLTLVTCYPFYYVGSAPKRFIVRAEVR